MFNFFIKKLSVKITVKSTFTHVKLFWNEALNFFNFILSRSFCFFTVGASNFLNSKTLTLMIKIGSTNEIHASHEAEEHDTKICETTLDIINLNHKKDR